jgi:hypothetical protein
MAEPNLNITMRKLLLLSPKSGVPKESGRKSRRVAEGTGRGRQGRRVEADMKMKTMKLKFAA